MSKLSARDAYLQSWGRLSNYLRNESPPIGKNPDTLNKWLSTYEKKVTDKIRPSLRNVGEQLSQPGSCNLGRGIVYINSAFTSARIRVPLLGKRQHGVTWKNWCSQVRAGNPEELMFLQPDTPKHLLTELMWRLQTRESWGRGYALGLFMSSQDAIYSALHACEDRWLFLTASDIERPLSGSTTSHTYDSAALRDRLNERLETVKNDCEVPYAPGYDRNDVERLTEHGLSVLEKCWHEGQPANAIFYLPDIVETEFVGGVAFEIVCSDKGSVPTEEDLSRFLRDVQWIIHESIIDLVITAERKTASLGETYSKAYFYSGAPSIAAQDDKVGIAQVLTDLKQEVVSTHPNCLASSVIDQLTSHFTLAFSERGMYWRGYASQAHEVACRVARILELMFPEAVKDGLADAVRRSGSTFEHLKKELEHQNQPFFIQQLFDGLRSENDLFYLPLYREHFIHSFHAFIIGVMLLGVRPKRVINSDFPLLTDDNFLRSWCLTAMWHDIAYPLEKASGLVEIGVRRLLGEAHTKRHVGLLPMQASVGNLFQVESLLSALSNEAVFWDKVLLLPKDINGKVNVRDAILASALDHIDHGIWSAFLLRHALASDGDGQDLLKRLGDDRASQVFAGIMPHHAGDWDWGDLAKTFWRKTKSGSYEYLECKPENGLVRISHHDNPLGYLLGLADILSQAGREAPEFDMSVPSKMGIRFQGVESGSDGSLVFALNYENPKKPIDKVMSKYFQEPAACLGMWGGKASTTKNRKRNGRLPDSLVIELRKKKDKDQLTLSLNLDGD